MAVVLRATAKVLKSMDATETAHTESDTALGDWCVNRVVVARQPWLLLVSARSFLAIVTPARDVKGLPTRLAGLVADRLARLGIESRLAQCEILEMEEVTVGKTRDRSVTGIMVDYAKMMPYFLPEGDDKLDPTLAEDQLETNPCRASRPYDEVIFPDRETKRLLRERWAG